MPQPPSNSPHVLNDDAGQVAILPPQFSLAETLLVITEIGLCLALVQSDFVCLITAISVGIIFLLLHLSRGGVGLGVLLGTVAGLPLTCILMCFITSFDTWAWVGSFFASTCALYGAALNAIATKQKLFGLPVFVLLLPFFAIVGMCLVMW